MLLYTLCFIFLSLFFFFSQNPRWGWYNCPSSTPEEIEECKRKRPERASPSIWSWSYYFGETKENVDLEHGLIIHSFRTTCDVKNRHYNWERVIPGLLNEPKKAEQYGMLIYFSFFFMYLDS
jgi:hypothetical protein